MLNHGEGRLALEAVKDSNLLLIIIFVSIFSTRGVVVNNQYPWGASFTAFTSFCSKLTGARIGCINFISITRHFNQRGGAGFDKRRKQQAKVFP